MIPSLGENKKYCEHLSAAIKKSGLKSSTPATREMWSPYPSEEVFRETVLCSYAASTRPLLALQNVSQG